jgi:hypothetical protein
MPDPRAFEVKACYLARDEGAYQAHLEEHERLAGEPEPQPDDGPAIVSLFEHIELLEQTIRKERQLIIALRQKAAQAPEEEG